MAGAYANVGVRTTTGQSLAPYPRFTSVIFLQRVNFWQVRRSFHTARQSCVINLSRPDRFKEIAGNADHLYPAPVICNMVAESIVVNGYPVRAGGERVPYMACVYHRGKVDKLWGII